MSEFSNEASNATLRMSEKFMGAIFKFLKFLIERKERKINMKLREEQLNNLKIKNSGKLAALKLEGKVGFIKAKELMRSGEKLIAVNIKLDKDTLKDFSRLAKKYGVLFTSISEKNRQGEKLHTVFIREKDLEKVKEITERMTEDLQLKTIENRIKELEGKHNKTEQDLQTIRVLKEQQREIIDNSVKAFNSNNAIDVFDCISNNMKVKALTFERGLNRFTDRDFSHDQPYYICERTNPSRYIEMISTLDRYKDDEYTKTDYKVYKDNKFQGDFTDKRFDGRPKGYWYKLREEMGIKGGFSNDIIIFNTKEEIDKYRNLYKMKQEKLLYLKVEEKDYQSIIEQLEKELQENKIEISPNAKNENIRSKENIIISRQIKNYDELAKLKVDLAMAEHEVKNDKEQVENIQILADARNIEAKIKECLKKEQELIEQREQIASLEVQEEVRENEDEIEEEQEQDREDTMTVEEWEKEVKKLQKENSKNDNSKDFEKDNSEISKDHER